MRFLDIHIDEIRGATVFLDVDGTLVPDQSATPVDTATLEHIRALARANDIHLVSNASGTRVLDIARAAGVSALPRSCKPFSPKMLSALTRRARTIVIGDKFLTDGLFALSLGAEFIKMDHLRSAHDSRFARATFLLDDSIWHVVSLVRLMRPLQWLKNLLVFTPLFFAGNLFSIAAFTASLAAFVLFCIAASSVYILNDLFDREQDGLHPQKKLRPLAAGHIRPRHAYAYLAVLAVVLGVFLAYVPVLIPIMILYLVTNSAYTLWLKHIPVVDIILVSLFYLMRIIAGGAVTGIPLSPWILLCAFFAALFIVIGKRRAELRHEAPRRVLASYSRAALDVMLAGSAMLAIMSYSLYSILGHNSHYLVYSTVFVIFAFLRMLNRIYTHPDEAEAPETILFKDPWVLGSFIVWCLYVFIVFYGRL